MEKIQDYAIIGNGRSVALISRNGSIDWLCWPRFDSPSIFANIIDLHRGGSWKISPPLSSSVKRHYIPESNVLETHFNTDSGTVILTDFMTALSEEEKAQELHPEHELIRQLYCSEGEVNVEVLFNPSPYYAKQKAHILDKGHFGLRIEVGQQLITLKTDIKFDSIGAQGALAVIKLKAGDKAYFSLTYSCEGPAVIAPIDGHLILRKLKSTISWWQAWASRTQYQGYYREMVIRSALTLKLLGFAPSGAFIAAATTSLPERLGGDLNWDYRFCWLRDASFTVRALLTLGYTEETEAFINWMLHSTRLTFPKLQVAYDVYGERMDEEINLFHLKGYAHSQPVRIGNASRDQTQLDVYGEVIEGVNYFIQCGGKVDREMQRVLRRIGNYVCKNWQKKDSGIWEERVDLDHYTYSRLMCWVALDKLLKLKEVCHLNKKEIKKFELNRSFIRKEIEDRGWNFEIKAYTSLLNGKKLDASMLLMPYYDFEEAAAPRMQQTFQKIKEKLGAGEGLIYRYEKSINQEGAFLICSFWEVDFMVRSGSIKEARQLFDRVIDLANDVGLFAEEIDPKSGDALGNFPQAFTHLGLINAAIVLMEKQNELE